MSKPLRRLLAAATAAAVLCAAAIALSASGGADRTASPAPPAGDLLRGLPERDGVLGDPRAPVTVTEFVDLQCPVCAAAARDTLPWLVRDHVRTGRVKLELRVLSFLGPDSRRAALAAAGAERQGRLWPFVEAFYAAQGPENSGYATDGFLREVADAAGVDAGAALRHADSEAAAGRLARADRDAARLGVQATPTFAVAEGDGPGRIVVTGVPDRATLEAALR